MPLECYDLTLISNSCWVGSCGDKLASGYEDKAGKCLEKLATCKKKHLRKIQGLCSLSLAVVVGMRTQRGSYIQ